MGGSASEQLFQRQQETWQDLPAGQYTVAVNVHRLLRRCANSRGARHRIDEPHQSHAGLEVLLQLASHLGLRVPVGQHFDGQVGHEIRDGLLGQFATRQTLPRDEGDIRRAHQTGQDVERAIRRKHHPKPGRVEESLDEMDQYGC